MLDEDDLTGEILAEKVNELYFTRQSYYDTMSKSGQLDSIDTIMGLINEVCEE